ncbi:MAG: hypothetical protein WCK76_03900, partial [Elusimicrobiota bacterium]
MSQQSPEQPLPGADILVSTPSLPADGSSVGSSAVAFSWTGPSTGAVAELGEGSYFALEVSSDAAFSAGNTVMNSSTAIVVDLGLPTADGAYISTVTLVHNTTYYWHVRTVDGVLLSSGPWSQVYSFVTDFASPVSVLDLDYSSVSTSSITLSWTAPGDNGADGVLNNSTFTIQYSSDSAAAWDIAAAQINISTSGVTPGTGRYYTLGGLAANTSYYFRLWTKDDVGNNSAVSNAATAATSIENPSGVYYDEIGTTTIVASAYAPAFTGMERGISGVNITTAAEYGVWGSTGNYWTTKTPLPAPRAYFAAGAIGGRLYAVGGLTGNSNEEYDPVSGSWTTKTPLLTARYYLAAGVIGGKLYAVGGSNGSKSLSANEEYDPAANTWVAKAPMPTARMEVAAGVSGGKLYAVGGNDSGSLLAVNEAYDPATDVWTTRTPMPTARAVLAVGVVGNRLYCVGGMIGVSNNTNANEEYNPADDTWTTKTAMPTVRSELAAGVIGGKLYAVGGGDGGQLNANEEYDPALNVWTARAALPTPRYGLSAAVIGGALYAVGGSNGSLVNTVEKFAPGVARVFAGLAPDTQYFFKAKARNQAGAETGESITVSTYTLAAVALSTGPAFTELFTSSVAVNWSSGTVAGGFNGPNASYLVQASSMSDFSVVAFSSATPGSRLSTPGLLSNTTYYFRAQAYNSSGVTDYSWLTLGATVTLVTPPLPLPVTQVSTYSITAAWDANGNSGGTYYTVQAAANSGFTPVLAASVTLNTSAVLGGLTQANTYYFLRVNAINRVGSPTGWVSLASTATAVEAPAGVYFDEVTSNTVVASAYAPAPAFTGLETGQSGTAVALNNAYNPWRNGNTWATKAPMPVAYWDFAIGVIGGKIYAVGGTDQASVFNTNREYDPVSNTWSTRTPMLTARSGPAVGVIGGKLYAVAGATLLGAGGYAGSDINEAYDPVANTWATKAVLPTPRSSLSAGVIGGKLYVVGGWNGSSHFTTNEEYDPASDTWATRAPMLTARRGMAIGAIGGKLYALGGINGDTHYDTNEEYDPVSDAWATKAAMPTARVAIAAGIIGGKLYAVGGDEAANDSNANEEYDPANNTWSKKAAIPTARCGLSAGVAGGKLYAMGGYEYYGSGLVDTNEEYDPGVASSFTALTPNTQYSFKARARNVLGAETGESVTVSTYTLAAVPVAAAPAFTAVYSSSFTVSWLAGDNPAGTTYYAQISTVADFTPVAFSSVTYGYGLTAPGLFANTTYYARVAAMNGGGLMTDYLALGSTMTLVERPTSIYFDEVSSNSITASGYAAGPAFTGLETGVSGVAVAMNNAYHPWRNGNTWATKAPMLTARHMLAAGVIGGKLYAVGGNDGSYLKTNEEYDPVSDSWATRTVMPTARQGLSVGVIGGKLYAVGGFKTGYVKTDANEEYDPAANTWSTKATMPTSRGNLSAGVIDGKLYAVGGTPDGNSSLDTNEEYDPATDTWTTKAVMPTVREWFAVGVIGGRLYAVGGTPYAAFLNTNERYDPAIDTWMTKAVMPTARYYLSAGVIGGKLYAMGGTDGSSINTNEEYDPEVDTWTTRAIMPAPRHIFAAGIIGGKLYAVGGNNGGYSD